MSRARAFTVVELLVVVGVVGVLLAVTVPALTGSRTTAESVEGLHTLRQLGVAYGAYTSDYDTTMPTLFARGDQGVMLVPNWGGNGFDVRPADQVWFWAYPLRTYVGDAPSDAASSRVVSRAVSTPCVFSAWEPHLSVPAEGLRNAYEVSAYYAAYSYLHCPTLFTSAGAWAAGSTPDLNGGSEPVSAAAIRSPSDKTNLVAVRTFYGENVAIQRAAPGDRANWLACDGHAEAIAVGSLRRGLPFGGGFIETHVELGVGYPGVGTIGGIGGRDR